MEDGKAKAEEWARAEGTLKLELLGVENQIGSALLPILQSLGSEVAKYAENGDLKRWADDAARGVIGLTIDRAELVDFFTSHNQIFGTILAVGGGAAFLESGSTAGLAAFVAGWKATGTGANEAAQKVHESTVKMIADLKEAQKQIGIAQPGTAAGGGAGAQDGTKTFNVPDPKLGAFNADYDKLLANYRQDLDYQQQLKTAYTEGAAAVRQLQVDHAGELAVYKLLDEAEAKHVQVSDQMLEAARQAAEADENAKLMASEQKTVTDALSASIKKHEEAIQALVDSVDVLTPKEQKLADTEGLLIEAFNRGLISADQFNAKLKELQDTANAGSDKGWKELTSGLSSDLTSLIGKATDFSTIMANKAKGQSIFSQYSQDADDFVKSLQQLLLKLLVINPLLNAIGLGDQGGGKLLPALIGSGAGSGSGSIPGFATGGDFVVGGGGGVDSSLVAFKATPGEHVSVGANAERGSSQPAHQYHMSMTVVTPDANTFLKSQDQIIGEGIRHMKKHAGRYA